MMGKQKKQDSLFTYDINLNNRVPENHPLRKEFWEFWGQYI